MIKTPLWQLSKKSLDPVENALEFSSFLKGNEMKHTRKKYINGRQFYIRLTVLLMVFQLQDVESSKWYAFYFIMKALYLFKFEVKRYKAIDFVILFFFYLIFPKIMSFLPLGVFIYWTVSFLYFFGGVSEKYLILQLLLGSSFTAINFAILISLGLGKINKKIKYSQILLVMDMILFCFFGKIKYIVFILIVLGCIQTIYFLDQKFHHQKRRYSHLFEIVEIQEFH